MTDAELVAAAVAAAAAADLRATPNPTVGAVLTHGGEVIATGVTESVGGAHAEVVALAAAGERARGATLAVTLEPCAHQGRTPPCVDAILAAGVARVVVAVADPDPRTAGRGIAALRAGGVEVVSGPGAGAAERLHRMYLHARRTGRPFVTAKFAASLDGRVATASGESRWITGEAARAEGHRLRARHDAVLAGVGTVLADDPALTARPPGGARRRPLRVVVDSRLRTPPGARLLTAAPEPPLLLTTAAAPAEREAALRAAGAEVVRLGAGPDGRPDLDGVLAHLATREVTSVLVEGGPTLLGALNDARRVDGVAAFLAPLLLGGRDALPAVLGTGIAALATAARLVDVTASPVGGDLLVTGYSDPNTDR